MTHIEKKRNPIRIGVTFFPNPSGFSSGSDFTPVRARIYLNINLLHQKQRI